MKRKDRGFPCDAAPDVHQFRGVPQDCFDLVNRYGTYNIQPTTDTENLFPLIGPELPERWRHMSLGKDDLEHLDSPPQGAAGGIKGRRGAAPGIAHAPPALEMY